MKPELEEWIRTASEEIEPVRWPGSVGLRMAVWLPLSVLMVLGPILVLGPMREGAFEALRSNPRFAIEIGIALLVVVTLVTIAFRLSRPDLTPRGNRVALVLLSSFAWAGIVALEIPWPSVEANMLGKREDCEQLVVALALGPIALGFALLRGLAPLDRGMTGAVLGAASGAIVALTMQFACMHEPLHGLTHHLAPVALCAALGWILGPWILRRI